jgi:serine/threonine protein kinase
VDRLYAEDPRQVGPFRVLERLGAGGMGQVYLGASAGGRRVAIKVIHPQHASDPDFRRRFAREVAAARQVGGFRTALVVDADPDAPAPWMATAYIPGPSLATAIAEQGPFDEAGTRRLGTALAEGLAAIHACGLIHRDLKPGNIILGADGPYIIDFGIAKHTDMTSITGSDMIIGTLRYMSPEQLGGQELTPLSDVFSLGVVLAYAATGRDPFSAPSIPAVVTRILRDPPDLTPLAGALRDLIASCLAKDATERPSLEDLLAQFTALDGSTADALVPAAQAATDSARPATGTLSVPGSPGLPVAAATPAGSQPDVPPSRPPQPAAAPRQESAPGGRGRWYRRPATLAVAVTVVVIGLAVPSALLLGVPLNGPKATAGQQHGPTLRASAATHPSAAARPSATASARSVAGYSATGSLLAALGPPGPTYGSDALTTVAFTPDTRTLLGGNTGNSFVYEWDTAKKGFPLIMGGTYPPMFVGNIAGVSGMAFSPKGGTLVTADGDGTIALWNGATGQRITRLGYSNNLSAVSVAFSPDGKTLAVGDYNGKVDLWNTSTWTLTRSLPAMGHVPVYAISFSPNGSVLVADGKGGQLTVWRTGKWSVIKAMTDPGGGQPQSVAFSPDGRLLATGDGNGSTYLWSTSTWQVHAKLPDPDSSGVGQIAFAGRDGILAAGDENGRVYLWNTTTRQLTATLAEPGGANVDSVAFASDAATLASGAANGKAYLWRITYHAP